MVNYYKPKYKKWLRNEKLIFKEKSYKFDKLKKKKWSGFKRKNKNLSFQNVVTFEEKLRLESEKGLYKKSLIQKQILKSFYGNISEKQFKQILLKSNLFNGKSKHSVITLLESRLDIFLYRANLVSSLYEAKQLISHKKVERNGVTVKSKGCLLSPGDLIQVKTPNVTRKNIEIKTNKFKIKESFKHVFVNHIQTDLRTKSAIFLEYPKIDEVFYPFNLNLKNVKEFYNI